ncbi:hypothetical protein B0H10DRAFT_2206726 [Mycena sp. CBHHK59/15]|nr:hypothetical protein B0H10DRAFT_2206726 [Mycena sp. CBHHK59/15]
MPPRVRSRGVTLSKPKVNMFKKFAPELYSEVLKHCSPFDLVTVRLISHAFLDATEVESLWRHIYQHFCRGNTKDSLLPMPPLFSSAAAAQWVNMVFGGGPCTSCGRHTTTVPFFQAAARLCGNMKDLGCLPYSLKDNDGVYDTKLGRLLVQPDMSEAREQLFNWRAAYNRDCMGVTQWNHWTTDRIAQSEGNIPVESLLRSPTFARHLDAFNRDLQFFTFNAWQTIRAVVRKERTTMGYPGYTTRTPAPWHCIVEPETFAPYEISGRMHWQFLEPHQQEDWTHLTDAEAEDLKRELEKDYRAVLALIPPRLAEVDALLVEIADIPSMKGNAEKLLQLHTSLASWVYD